MTLVVNTMTAEQDILERMIEGAIYGLADAVVDTLLDSLQNTPPDNGLEALGLTPNDELELAFDGV